MSPTQTIYSSHIYPTVTPLATIWSPPASCITPVPTIFIGVCYNGQSCSTTGTYASYYKSKFVAWANYAYWTTGYSQVNVDCYPPGYQNVPEFSFSPARGCPSGYTTAQSSQNTYYSDVTIACCPPGYPYTLTLNHGSDLACYRSITKTGEHFQLGAYGTIDQVDQYGVSQDFYQTFSSIGSTTLKTLPTDPASLNVYAQAIKMVVPSSWNSAATTGTPTSTYDPYHYPTATGAAQSSSFDALGLTLPVWIGIGIVGLLLFCACPCLIWYCVRRRRRRRRRAIYGPPPTSYPPSVQPVSTRYGPHDPYPSAYSAALNQRPASILRPAPNSRPAPVLEPAPGLWLAPDPRLTPVPARKCFKNPPCASSKVCAGDSCCLCKDHRTRRMSLEQRLAGGYYCSQCSHYWTQQPKERWPWLMPMPVRGPTQPSPRHFPNKPLRQAIHDDQRALDFSTSQDPRIPKPKHQNQKKKGTKMRQKSEDKPSPSPDTIFVPWAKRHQPKRKLFLSVKAPETAYTQMQDQGPKHTAPEYKVVAPGILGKTRPQAKNRTSTSFEKPLSGPFAAPPITIKSSTAASTSPRPSETDYSQTQDQGPKSTAPEFQVPLSEHQGPTHPPAATISLQSRTPSCGPAAEVTSSSSSSASRVPSTSTWRTPSIGVESSILDSSSNVGSPITSASSSLLSVSRATSRDIPEAGVGGRNVGRKGKYASLRYDGPKLDPITKGL